MSFLGAVRQLNLERTAEGSLFLHAAFPQVEHVPDFFVVVANEALHFLGSQFRRVLAGDVMREGGSAVFLIDTSLVHLEISIKWSSKWKIYTPEYVPMSRQKHPKHQ